MASKQLVTLSGTVESVNDKGIKVCGQWANFSMYHPITSRPTHGELVEMEVEESDRGSWINSLRILGAAPAGLAPASSDQRSAEIRRQVAMKCASQLVGAFAGANGPGTVKAEMVFPLADKILAWLEKEDAIA